MCAKSDIASRLTAIVVIMALLPVLSMGGARITARAHLPSDCPASASITFDVCGAMAPGLFSTDAIDCVINTSDDYSTTMTASVYPPVPVQAVASADPGDAERPPEA